MEGATGEDLCTEDDVIRAVFRLVFLVFNEEVILADSFLLLTEIVIRADGLVMLTEDSLL